MIFRFLEPHRGAITFVHRAPAELKLALGFLVIAITVLVPGDSIAWLICAFLLVATAAGASRIPVGFLMQRLLLLAPFVVGVTLVNALQPTMRGHWPWLLARSLVCLLAVIIVSNTTPFGEVLRVLRRLRVPALLITTIALMHRYLFVLGEEAQRMGRARASRTLVQRKHRQWTALSGVAAQLFIRASERAERIYGAMCARGLK